MMAMMATMATLGDIRLKAIWKLRNFYGLLTVREDWQINMRASIVINFMAIFYVNDIMSVARTIIEGKFVILEDVQDLIFIQSKGIVTYELYLMVRYGKKMARLVKMIIVEFPSWSEGDSSVMEHASKKGRKICVTYFALITIVVTLMVFRPLVSQQSMTLPFGMNHTNLEKSWSLYSIKYCFQICYITMAYTVGLTTDILIFTMIMRTSSLMEHLPSDMEKISRRRNASPELTAFTIQTFVDRHNAIRE